MLVFFSGIATGCKREDAVKTESKPPEVTVELPVRESVTEYQEFTGQTMAKETIELRSRVSGYLDRTEFKDGDIVEKGKLLFQIDDRPYRAERDRTAAALKQAEAHLERLKKQKQRALALFEKKAISQEDFDTATFDFEEATAAVEAARASHETANLNLSYTTINATIAGRISRRLVDPGNLIQADVTPLTTLVSVHPMYAYFDIDERTLLRLRRMSGDSQRGPDAGTATGSNLHSGSSNSPQSGQHSDLSLDLDVNIALADGEPVRQGGKINFLDNQVEGTTGTLRARVEIHNEDALLSPGLFVRLRVPVGTRYALLVREQSLQTNQGQRFVWVVNADNKAVQKAVKIGWQTENGRRVILEGLDSGDQVVVTGVQRVRAAKEVSPKPFQAVAEVASKTTKPGEPESPQRVDGGR
jgi:multidrug efflux system membrane fusion protein